MKILEKWWFWFTCSFLLYTNTLNHSYTIDDLIVVTSNKLTQKGIDGIPDIFQHSYLYGYDGREDESYRPLTLATFAMEKSLFDADSAVSHFIQVVLYGLCILVLFKFLRNLFGEEKLKLVVAITFLYMVHPIHTEVVANVKSRDELMCALFLFSSLWMFTNWLKSNSKLQLLWALVFFFAATLSKETAVLGVVLFPAVHYFMNKSTLKDIALKSLLFIVPFLLYFGIRSAVLSDVLIQDPIDPVANSLALAANGSEQLSTNLSIFSKYIQLALMPVNMSWDYSIATFPIKGFGSATSIVGTLFLLFLFVILIFGIFKRNMLGLAALIFLSTFALTSNFFFLINCTLGERFLFIPVLGIIMIFCIVFYEYFTGILHRVSALILVVFCVFYAGRTISRNLDWKNNQTIYESGVRVSPNSVKTHFNLGTEYLEIGNRSASLEEKNKWYGKAIKEFKRAKEIYPAYVNTYENIGFVYAELGKINENREVSINHFKAGLLELNFGIDSLKLDKPSLYQNKYFILEQLISKTDSEAEKKDLMWEMIETIDRKRNKNADDFHRQLYYLHLMHQHDRLIIAAKELLLHFPEKKDFILELSKEYFEEKNYNVSLELMTIYVDKFPNDLSAKSNKGMLLEITGNKKEALKTYEEILAVDPNQLHTKELYDILKRN